MLLEAVYRVYLARLVAGEVERRMRAAVTPDAQMFRVWAVAPWKFDRELGYFVRQVRAVTNAYKVQPIFVWQPTPV